MSLKSRVSSKLKKYSGIDLATGIGHKVSDAAKRTGEKARSAYQRYKDPLIIGTGAVVGGILGSVIPVIGTAAGAGLGMSLASGAVGAHHAQKQAAETKKAEKAFDAQQNGLGGGGLLAAIRRRRLQRGAGDAVTNYSSDNDARGFDEHEVAA